LRWRRRRRRWRERRQRRPPPPFRRGGRSCENDPTPAPIQTAGPGPPKQPDNIKRYGRKCLGFKIFCTTCIVYLLLAAKRDTSNIDPTGKPAWLAGGKWPSRARFPDDVIVIELFVLFHLLEIKLI
jgi:hypothetical protein